MNYVYIATSIDGYIAKADGDIDWLHEQPNPTNSDYGYAEFIANIDALVMGRNSFDKVRSFDEWPYEKKVFVLSSSITKVPDDLIGKVELLTGTPEQVTSNLNALGFNNLYIDGGQLIQSFMAADLIDELIVTRMPIVLGSGIPLFGRLAEPIKFSHQHTQVYDNILVKTHYSRNRLDA